MTSVALRSLSDRQYTCCTASFFLILPANRSLRLEVQVEQREERYGQTSQCSLSSRAWCLPRRVNWSHPPATPCSWDITPAKNPRCGRNFPFSISLSGEKSLFMSRSTVPRAGVQPNKRSQNQMFFQKCYFLGICFQLQLASVT